MSVARRVTLEEESIFLRLLCDVFDLDFRRASSIFFAEPLHDSRQNWGLFVGDKLQSILTLTPLEFGFGPVMGISGVATLPEFRGRGQAHELLAAAIAQAESDGCAATCLFAHRLDLYADLGFKHVDDVIRAPLLTTRYEALDLVASPDVREHYSRWSEAAPDRLRRDATRWDFWNWTPRSCEALNGGYFCNEGSLIREAVLEPGKPWPLGAGMEWLGLRSLTEREQVPIGPTKHDLYYMVRGTEFIPQLFMTDQF